MYKYIINILQLLQSGGSTQYPMFTVHSLGPMRNKEVLSMQCCAMVRSMLGTGHPVTVNITGQIEGFGYETIL